MKGKRIETTRIVRTGHIETVLNYTMDGRVHMVVVEYPARLKGGRRSPKGRYSHGN